MKIQRTLLEAEGQEEKKALGKWAQEAAVATEESEIIPALD